MVTLDSVRPRILMSTIARLQSSDETITSRAPASSTWKPGRRITSAPKKPQKMAVQRRQRNTSPRKSALSSAVNSALFLGEVFRWRRWTAIFCGFFGALVILRPGFQVLDAGALLVIVSSLLWSLAIVDIKILGRTESSVTITAYVTVLMIP